MLEKPALEDEQIANCLRDEYGLHVENISFLSLGADVNSSVYCAITRDGEKYFVKLRKENSFKESSVTIPNFLSASGIKEVIPPLRTRTGQLWTYLPPFIVTTYPFVDGHAGLDIKMSVRQWFEFGAALKRFHSTHIPTKLTKGIQRDTFSPQWRNKAKMHLEYVEKETFREYIEIESADFLKSKRCEMLDIVGRADHLAQILQDELPDFILCHSDIHGYNLFIDNNGALYIIDWDGLMFAPKERDLMFIGGGHGDSGYSPQEEVMMFYQGYGQTHVDQIAIAYYRYERILMDIVDDCDLIFFSNEGEENQKAAFEDLKNKFLPNSYIEIAYRSDKVVYENHIPMNKSCPAKQTPDI